MPQVTAEFLEMKTSFSLVKEKGKKIKERRMMIQSQMM
jgi:hypothetical protein